MKINLALALLLVALLPTQARAQSLAFPAIRGSAFEPQSKATPALAGCRTGKPCLFWDGSAAGPIWKKANGDLVTLGAGGGGGSIGGSIASGQVAYASGSDTIAGSANFTWANTAGEMSLAGTAPAIMGNAALSLYSDTTSSAQYLKLDDAGGGLSWLSGATIYVDATGGSLSIDANDLSLSAARTVSSATSAADGASAVAFKVNTSSAWSNGAARLLSLQTNSAEKFYVLASGGARFGANSRFLVSGDGLYAPSGINGIMFYDSVLLLTGTGMRPNGPGIYLGSPSTYLWSEVGTQLVSTTQGSDLSISSNTITPTAMQHRVGAGLLKTITVPGSGAFSGRITIMPTAAYTMDGTGNIDVAGSAALAVVGKPMDFTYFATQSKWYPSY